MKEVGCIQVALGCEGAGVRQLELVHKRIKPDNAKRACALLKEAGVQVQTYWIIGLPGENRESARATISTISYLIESGLTDVTHIALLVPYPGTRIYASPLESGIEIIDRDPSMYWMNCDPFGCGMPVYRTVRTENGITEILLSPQEIYDLWLQALNVSTIKYDELNSRV